MKQERHFGLDHYPIVSAGIDWLTATTTGLDGLIEFRDIGFEMFAVAKEAGDEVMQQTRQGFSGWSCPHFFYGKSAGASMIQVSSGLAHLLTGRVATAASNVSRLDLQVTLDTSRDTPDLCLHGFKTLEHVKQVTGRPGGYSLTQKRPVGDMLTVNQRISDQYGRLYDKASESKVGPPRTMFRYEVEYKRKRAMHVLSSLEFGKQIEPAIAGLVWDWFASRGLEPYYPYTVGSEASGTIFPRTDTNVLHWFETSVSVTVGRSIRRHGLTATLDALGISPLVSINATTQGE